MTELYRRFVHIVEYVTLRLGETLAHVAGFRASYAIARFLGDVIYRFNKRHRDRAVRHLQLSFPDWPQEKYRQVARASIHNQLLLGLEVLITTRWIKPARWRRHITLREMGPTIRRLLEHGSGMIFLTGHFGNWEVVGYTMATLGFRTYAVARAFDNPYINRWMLGFRESTGLVILDKRGVSMETDGLLADRQIVSFIVDQDAGRKGCFVDFFGRKASTYKSIALLAMRHDVPVVVGYCRRLGQPFRFEIGVQRTILPAEWADKDDPMTWITQEYTHALEDVVRSAPEQYLWIYRRWRHRPRGEQPTPDGIA